LDSMEAGTGLLAQFFETDDVESDAGQEQSS